MSALLPCVVVSVHDYKSRSLFISLFFRWSTIARFRLLLLLLCVLTQMSLSPQPCPGISRDDRVHRATKDIGIRTDVVCLRRSSSVCLQHASLLVRLNDDGFPVKIANITITLLVRSPLNDHRRQLEDDMILTVNHILRYLQESDKLTNRM